MWPITKFFEVVLLFGEGSSSLTFTCSRAKVPLHSLSPRCIQRTVCLECFNFYWIMPFPTFSPLVRSRACHCWPMKKKKTFADSRSKAWTKRAPIVEYVMQSNSTLSLKQVMLKACYNYHQRKGFMSRNHLRVYPSFWGCHNTTWVSLKRKYNLKWSSGKGSLEIFERCYGDDSPRVWIQCCNGSDKCGKSFHCHIATYFCFVPWRDWGQMSLLMLLG